MNERQRREALGVGLVALGVLVMLALVPQLLPGRTESGNLIGPAGELLSLGLNTVFGAASVLVGLPAFVWALWCFGILEQKTAVRWSVLSAGAMLFECVETSQTGEEHEEDALEYLLRRDLRSHPGVPNRGDSLAQAIHSVGISKQAMKNGGSFSGSLGSRLGSLPCADFLPGRVGESFEQVADAVVVLHPPPHLPLKMFGDEELLDVPIPTARQVQTQVSFALGTSA